MKKLKVKSSKPIVLAVTFIAWGEAILSIKGFEKGKQRTVYFDRLYGSADKPVRGRVEVLFPMPVKFSRLGIEVNNTLNSSKVQIETIKPRPLNQRALAVKEATKGYIKFAQQFAVKCGHLALNNYASEDGSFKIHLLDKIRDHARGEIIPTPARVNHVSGIIEVSKADFDKMTVANRFFILMHEYAHYANNTTDEIECDMLATKTLMELGYSSIECLYSVTKLFMYNTEETPGLKAQQERRVMLVKEFINQFAAL